MRHGETDYNARNVVQGGGIDSDLNAVGHEQAAQFYKRYHKVPFAAVYSSGLKRTRQTLAPFEASGNAVTAHAGLNEMGWGVMEGIEHNGEIERLFRATLNRWAEGDFNHAVEGGETPLAVLSRASRALVEIITAHPEGNLLICTHGRTLRIILCYLLGYDMRHMQWFRHSNTALNLLVRTGRSMYVEKMNDLSHLK